MTANLFFGNSAIAMYAVGAELHGNLVDSRSDSTVEEVQAEHIRYQAYNHRRSGHGVAMPSRNTRKSSKTSPLS